MMTVKELLIREALYFLCGAVIIGGAILLQQFDDAKTATAQTTASTQSRLN